MPASYIVWVMSKSLAYLKVFYASVFNLQFIGIHPVNNTGSIIGSYLQTLPRAAGQIMISQLFEPMYAIQCGQEYRTDTHTYEYTYIYINVSVYRVVQQAIPWAVQRRCNGPDRRWKGRKGTREVVVEVDE